MALVGADVEQLGNLGRSFATEASEVDALTARITAILGGTAWTGPGADRFREQWSGEFVPSLTQLKEALSVSSTAVLERQQAIETATA